jgi:hypothetical protein
MKKPRRKPLLVCGECKFSPVWDEGMKCYNSPNCDIWWSDEVSKTGCECFTKAKKAKAARS